MKPILLFVLLISFSKSIFSQDIKTDSLLLTENQNIEWISELENVDSLSNKIIKIKTKILNDTLFNRTEKPCKVKAVKRAYDVIEMVDNIDCQCKILFILNFKKFGYVLNPLEYTKTIKILDLLNDKNVDEIKVYQGTNARRYYGVKGRCGVVVLSSKNRKLKRKIKNLF